MNTHAKSWRDLQDEKAYTREQRILSKIAPWILLACLIAGGIIDSGTYPH